MYTTNLNYMEYYSDWKRGLANAKNLFDMKSVGIIATAFISQLNDLWDQDRLPISVVSGFIEEVNRKTEEKRESIIKTLSN